MKGTRFAALMIIAAVTAFLHDNGPDPGFGRLRAHHGRKGAWRLRQARRAPSSSEPRFAFGFPFVDGIARVTQSGRLVEVPGSSGEYHRWESDEWFCIDKTGAAVECR